jgi:hypothetical protein
MASSLPDFERILPYPVECEDDRSGDSNSVPRIALGLAVFAAAFVVLAGALWFWTHSPLFDRFPMWLSMAALMLAVAVGFSSCIGFSSFLASRLFPKDTYFRIEADRFRIYSKRPETIRTCENQGVQVARVNQGMQCVETAQGAFELPQTVRLRGKALILVVLPIFGRVGFTWFKRHELRVVDGRLKVIEVRSRGLIAANLRR